MKNSDVRLTTDDLKDTYCPFRGDQCVPNCMLLAYESNEITEGYIKRETHDAKVYSQLVHPICAINAIHEFSLVIWRTVRDKDHYCNCEKLSEEDTKKVKWL